MIRTTTENRIAHDTWAKDTLRDEATARQVKIASNKAAAESLVRQIPTDLIRKVGEVIAPMAVIGNADGRFPRAKAWVTGLSKPLDDRQLIRGAEVRNLPGDTLDQSIVRARQVDILIGDQQAALLLGRDRHETAYYLSDKGQIGQSRIPRYPRDPDTTVVGLSRHSYHSPDPNASIIREWQTDERRFPIPQVIFGAAPNFGRDPYDLGDDVVSLLRQTVKHLGIKPDDLKS